MQNADADSWFDMKGFSISSSLLFSNSYQDNSWQKKICCRMTGSIVSLFFIGLVAGAFAGSDNPLAVEIADGVTIEPTYDPDTGAVGISITIEYGDDLIKFD